MDQRYEDFYFYQDPHSLCVGYPSDGDNYVVDKRMAGGDKEKVVTICDRENVNSLCLVASAK